MCRHVKQAREATNTADDIENAVYDLKAVNPHRKAEVDRRTPAELRDLVEAKGVEIAKALKALKALIALTSVGAVTGEKYGRSLAASP